MEVTSDWSKIPVQFACGSCGKWGFHYQKCSSCGCIRLCLRKTCQEHHASQCHGVAGWPAAVFEAEQGRILEIDSCLEEAGKLVLDLGSSNSCPKYGHNQHADYIDVTKFRLEHLPEKIRHPAMLDFILGEALLTVRITTRWTSRNRPDNDPYADTRGQRNSRTATGSCNTYECPDTFRRQLCDVPNCHRKSDLGDKHFIFCGDIFVYTNKHVVFDEEEMRTTSVEFFYDTQDRSTVVKEYGLKFCYTKMRSDRSFFTITVHDECFLKLVLNHAHDTHSKEYDIPDQVIENLKSFIIVISHPHGMPKKISIGNVIKTTVDNSTPETEENSKSLGLIYLSWAQAALSRHVKYSASITKQGKQTDEKAPGKNDKEESLNMTERKEQQGVDLKECECSSNDRNVCKAENTLENERYVKNYTGSAEAVGPRSESEHTLENERYVKNYTGSSEAVGPMSEYRSGKNAKRDGSESGLDVVLQSKATTILPALGRLHGKRKEGCQLPSNPGVVTEANDNTRPNTELEEVINEDNDSEDQEENRKVDFMASLNFPIVTKFHDAPTCQGSSGAPTIHGGFQIGGLWVRLSGGHFGCDMNCKCSFFSYIKPCA